MVSRQAHSLAVCTWCGMPSSSADAVGACRGCLISAVGVDERVRTVREASRSRFRLPAVPPRTPGGVRCTQCTNQCVIGGDERGYCGLRTATDGRLRHLAGTPSRGLLRWYRDPLPTNCVADWVCEGSRQKGCTNLAVFYASCTMDCLFCQNWHFRDVSPDDAERCTAVELVDAATPQTFCVCYFGGDPSSQMGHALAASVAFASRGLRVCWETNGTMHPGLLDRAVELSLESGGCIKFDLKAMNDRLHVALTGVSNSRTLQNFRRAGERVRLRPDPPLVIASTLLVPDYVTPEEVGNIAGFIASVDPTIPYALLAFAPQYLMGDLPPTSAAHAREAEAAAREAGLTRIRIGNRHLLTGTLS